MSEFIGFYEFLQKVKLKYGEDCDENTTIAGLYVSVEEFEEFLESNFEFNEKQKSLIKSSLAEDMILYTIYNSLFS